MVKEEGEEEGEERQKAGVGWAKCACVCVFVNESVNARMSAVKVAEAGGKRQDIKDWPIRVNF